MHPLQLNSNNYVTFHFIDNRIRPFVLIAPGGGYQRTSPREAEPIAKAFNQAGYHAGIIYYRETLLQYPDTVDELASFIQVITTNEAYPIDKEAFILCGFSSGGHYMASMGVYHHQYPGLISPKAMILAYPVITGKAGYAHEDSIKRLYGEITEDTRHRFSLENHVTNLTPETFLFHTIDDQTVKVENSLYFMEALRKHHVAVDCHLYHSGVHGLSLGTKEVVTDAYTSDPLAYEAVHKHNQTWFDLAISFLNFRIKKA
jgi:acetyl esterase/lipase